MLKFLDFVLKDIKDPSPEQQEFFSQMLANFLPYLNYSLYE
jgi:hypothetical protein